MAEYLPSLLVRSCRRARAPSRQNGKGAARQRQKTTTNRKETMTTYAPGAAFGAEIQKEGDTWTLVLVRTLRHPPKMVWEALTDPSQLHEWAPFDVDRNLGSAGPVKLST